MFEDPIVAEVHAMRQKILESVGYDLAKYCEFLRSLPAPGHEGTATVGPNPTLEGGDCTSFTGVPERVVS